MERSVCWCLVQKIIDVSYICTDSLVAKLIDIWCLVPKVYIYIYVLYVLGLYVISMYVIGLYVIS